MMTLILRFLFASAYFSKKIKWKLKTGHPVYPKSLKSLGPKEPLNGRWAEYYEE